MEIPGITVDDCELLHHQPEGLKPYNNHGINHQLVQDFATIHRFFSWQHDTWGFLQILKSWGIPSRHHGCFNTNMI